MINFKEYFPLIDKIFNPTKLEFNEMYGFMSKPVLINNIVDQWPAKSKWTSEYFESELGSFEEYAVRTNNRSDKKLFTVSDYIQYMKNCSDQYPYYLKNSQFHLKAGMINDYSLPSYFRSCFPIMSGLPFDLSWIFIGATSTYSGLHLDIYNTSAWNAVFTGRKIWLFYHPQYAKYLYNGMVNPFEPDIDKYPEFVKAIPLVCIQNPGEVVFTPGGWWHAVFNEEGGISLTENFVNETNRDLVRSTLLSDQKLNEVQLLDRCMAKFIESNNDYL